MVLRVRIVSHSIETKTRRLLRLLLVWQREMPTDSSRKFVLRLNYQCPLLVAGRLIRSNPVISNDRRVVKEDLQSSLDAPP